MVSNNEPAAVAAAGWDANLRLSNPSSVNSMSIMGDELEQTSNMTSKYSGRNPSSTAMNPVAQQSNQFRSTFQNINSMSGAQQSLGSSDSKSNMNVHTASLRNSNANVPNYCHAYNKSGASSPTMNTIQSSERLSNQLSRSHRPHHSDEKYLPSNMASDFEQMNSKLASFELVNNDANDEMNPRSQSRLKATFLSQGQDYESSQDLFGGTAQFPWDPVQQKIPKSKLNGLLGSHIDHISEQDSVIQRCNSTPPTPSHLLFNDQMFQGRQLWMDSPSSDVSKRSAVGIVEPNSEEAEPAVDIRFLSSSSSTSSSPFYDDCGARSLRSYPQDQQHYNGKFQNWDTHVTSRRRQDNLTYAFDQNQQNMFRADAAKDFNGYNPVSKLIQQQNSTSPPSNIPYNLSESQLPINHNRSNGYYSAEIPEKVTRNSSKFMLDHNYDIISKKASIMNRGTSPAISVDSPIAMPTAVSVSKAPFAAHVAQQAQIQGQPISRYNALQQVPPNSNSSPDLMQKYARAEEYPSLRSLLLEAFRFNRNMRLELKDIKGHVAEFAGDQHGSRFLQQKLETASWEEKDLVFREILPNSLQLMTDVFGNYVIQKMLEHGNQLQKSEFARKMEGHMQSLSLQMYGCRVVQKALELLLADQQLKLVNELKECILKCIKDQNGNHVVQRIIERLPHDKITFITDAIRGQAYALATHTYGCRVVQRVFEHIPSAQVYLLDELSKHTRSLIQDQYGNYVVQHVIEHGGPRPEDRENVIKAVKGNLIQFSKHKFASNVVEKCLIFGDAKDVESLIEEALADTPDGVSPLAGMMKDQFANYVIQKLLETAKGDQLNRLINKIKPQLALLKQITYGKHIASIEKQLAIIEGPCHQDGAEVNIMNST